MAENREKQELDRHRSEIDRGAKETGMKEMNERDEETRVMDVR